MATNPRLLVLKDEFDANRAGLDYLDQLAAQEKRDLTPDERIKYDGALGRMEVIEKDIVDTLAADGRHAALAAVTATILPEAGRAHVPAVTNARNGVTFDPAKAGQAYVRPGQVTEDIGEFALALGRAKLGKCTLEEANEVLSRWDVSVEDENGRVVAHGVAADGTAPITIEGDLIKFVDANRYAVNQSRRLPMPDNHAPTFKRPRVTQRTTVGVQTTEGDVLSSQRLQLTGDTVTKLTRGGVLALSEQEIDWTDPALLGLAIEDLAESYAIDTDTVLTAAIEAAASDANETVCSLTAASDVFIQALASAAVTVYGNSKKLADKFFVSIDRWGYMAGLVDGDGRPMFPITGPMNAAGGDTGGLTTFTGFNVMGLDVVVDPNFSANIWVVAVSKLIEFYEQNKGLLSIAAPSTLEVQYAYRGYCAANVYSQGLSGLEAV